MDYFRVPQHTIPQSAGSDEEDDEVEEGHEDWLWRTTRKTSASGSSSSLHRQQHNQTPRSPKRDSNTSSRTRALTEPAKAGTNEKFIGAWGQETQMSYGTPVSPNASPARRQLQRSAKSAPSVPRSPHYSPQQLSQKKMEGHSRRTSLDYVAKEMEACNCNGETMTPHEAVLKSRLEGVLRSARAVERSSRSQERGSGSSGSGGNSMSSSRNLSGEGEGGDWFFGESGYTTSPTADTATTLTGHTYTTSSSRPPRTPITTQRALSVSTSNRHPRSPSARQGHASPMTPPLPPTPPSFNARTAAEQCRAMNGYVSFANVEGLGLPDGLLDDVNANGEDGGSKRGRWLKWFTGAGGRDRSESIGA